MAAGGLSLLAASAHAQTPPAPLTHRWLDVQTLNLTVRYRRIVTTADVVTANQMQHSETVKARFTFDRSGRYALVAGLATGATLTGGWNNAGIGTPNDPQMQMSLKQLHLSASPWRGVEAQYGGLYAVRGENTEITSYDNDAYLAGERITIKRPGRLHLDEISATAGYLGDTSQPNFFRRYKRLSERDYYQILIARKIGKSAGVSGDLTGVSGVRTLRSAISVRAPKTVGLDLIRIEAYHRFDAAASGYAIFAEKVVTKRFTAGLGTADIDLNYGGLNGDRFGKGQRWFVNASLAIVPELSVLTFYQHAFSNSVPLPNRSRLEFLLQFNALKALQRARWY